MTRYIAYGGPCDGITLGIKAPYDGRVAYVVVPGGKTRQTAEYIVRSGTWTYGAAMGMSDEVLLYRPQETRLMTAAVT